MRKAQISALAIVLGGISILGSVLGFSSYFNGKIEAANTRIGKTEGNVQEINVKLDFILGRYGGQWNETTKKVEIVISTSTNQ